MAAVLEDMVVEASEVFLIDTCSLGDIELDSILESPGKYFIPQHVIDEHWKWGEKERKKELRTGRIPLQKDGRNRSIRAGYLAMYDSAFSRYLELDDKAKAEENPAKKENIEKKRDAALEECRTIVDEHGDAFFNDFIRCSRVVDYFEAHAPEQIIRTHANHTIQEYSKLLTKSIIADLISSSQGYRAAFESGNTEEIVNAGVAEYEKRLAEFGLIEELGYTVVDADSDFRRAVGCMQRKYCRNGKNIRAVVRGHERSVQNDINTVFAAYTFRNRLGSADTIRIVTRDRDINELVGYINAAKSAGHLNGAYSNNVEVTLFDAGGRRK